MYTGSSMPIDMGDGDFETVPVGYSTRGYFPLPNLWSLWWRGAISITNTPGQFTHGTRGAMISIPNGTYPDAQTAWFHMYGPCFQNKKRATSQYIFSHRYWWSKYAKPTTGMMDPYKKGYPVTFSFDCKSANPLVPVTMMWWVFTWRWPIKSWFDQEDHIQKNITCDGTWRTFTNTFVSYGGSEATLEAGFGFAIDPDSTNNLVRQREQSSYNVSYIFLLRRCWSITLSDRSMLVV